MELQNLNNMFTVFGNFLVFDEDVMPRVNKVYANCNISINQEPNNPQNKSGRVMKIVNIEKHITIFLRPNRIDVQCPGMKKEGFVQLLQTVSDIFSEIGDIAKEMAQNKKPNCDERLFQSEERRENFIERAALELDSESLNVA